MPGQALIDDENNIYDDDLYEYDLTTICNKTLHPYVLSYHFKDPEGREIEDSAVLNWLKYYDMLQTDICALGNDAAATDDLYEDYLLNCDIRVWNAGGALSITAFSVSNGVVSVTVQLVRNAPMGAIQGHLYLYGANDLAAGFDRSPIADESIDFGTDDPSFDTDWLTVSLTQSVTATFDVSHAPYRFFKAVIGPIIPNEPEPEPEPEPED